MSLFALPHEPLTTWDGNRPRKTDVSIAKNYLQQEEIESQAKESKKKAIGKETPKKKAAKKPKSKKRSDD